MAEKKSVQTGWVIAATEGATVDGRTITKAWIEEMAETYSVDEYTAVIWPEHFRSSWGPFEGKNWGTVDEVKAAKKGGKTRLFVKLTANSFLLDANKDGQKLFMSIEINTDFAAKGKCYLQGLAVTDSPASTGTTRLKFSMGETEAIHDYSQLEPLQYSDFMFTHGESPTTAETHKAEQAKSLFAQLINLFSTTETPANIHSTNHSTNQATDTPENAEDETMKQEQFDALMGKFDNVTDQVANLETKFSDLDAKVEKFNATGEADPEENPTIEKPDTVINPEQFSQLNDNLNGLVEKFGALETKFNELSQESAGQEPDPSGQGESVSLV